MRRRLKGPLTHTSGSLAKFTKPVSTLLLSLLWWSLSKSTQIAISCATLSCCCLSCLPVCLSACLPVCLSACLPVIQTLTPSRPSTPAVVQPRHGTGDCFYRNLLHAASPRLALHIPHLNMAFSKIPTSHARLCTRNRWPKIIAATITRRTTYNNRSPQSSQAALHTALVP
jgi:hypothetical protein